MKVLVLISEVSESGEWMVDNLNKYTNDEYLYRRYSDVAVCIRNNNVEMKFMSDGGDLKEYDLVYLRGITCSPLRHAIALYLQRHGIAIVNHAESVSFQMMTKLEQNVALALAQVPVADSLYTVEGVNYANAMTQFDFRFPLVAKAIDGKNGAFNEIVKSDEDLNRLNFEGAILQKFIPNDFDYRVIMAGDEVILAYKRIRNAEAGSHKNNVTLGGKIERTELPNALRNIAVNASKVTRREFTGLDIIVNTETGDPAILEVNFNFGMIALPLDGELEKEDFYQKINKYFRSLCED